MQKFLFKPIHENLTGLEWDANNYALGAVVRTEESNLNNSNKLSHTKLAEKL